VEPDTRKTDKKDRKENIKVKKRNPDTPVHSHLDPDEQDLSVIIEVPSLQSLMEKFFALTHTGIGIIDLKGNILVKVGWQDACTKFHRLNPLSLQNCLESDVVLTQGVRSGEFREYKCKNHMWDIVTPLFINERHVGNIFFGQYFYTDEKIDDEIFTAQATEFGFEKGAYLAAIKSVQRLSRQEVKNLMVFFAELAGMISRISYSNLKLSQTLAEQKKVEQSLQESRKDLARAQQVSHTGNWRLDISQNKLQWSEETYRIFGIPFGTPMTYEKFLSTIDPEDKEKVDKKWKAALDGAPYDIEHRIVVGDKVKWVRERAELEFDGQGKLSGGFGTVHDMTERKQAEESLNRYTRDLEEAVEELESFSYSVSHDLRQPLRAIDGFSQAVIEGYEDRLDERGKDYLNRVRKSSQLMSQLIDDILKLTKVARADMYWERVDLSEMVKSIARELEAAQPERKAQFTIASGVIANGDKELLEIMLRNIIGNAWKFTGKRERTDIQFGSSRQNRSNVCFIKDNGAGFDMRYSDKLFKPFQRLHREEDYPGTGIGLASAQRIIHRHGGRIWAESGVGKGTTIYFTCDFRMEP
jgi:PAS domain S-box-containing protein